ncbi:MAG: hypothetical protein M0T73_10800 [Deltaproteobacteria bacterium]|nr:hypothetical protein [Deltaproteobacteria bacterium]
MHACPYGVAGKGVDENNKFIEISRNFDRISTLATLHPMMRGLTDEIRRIFDLGITGFKFSSFSHLSVKGPWSISYHLRDRLAMVRSFKGNPFNSITYDKSGLQRFITGCGFRGKRLAPFR